VSRGRQAAQRESTGMSTHFRSGRSPIEKPGPGSRTCRAGSLASAKRGGLSLGRRRRTKALASSALADKPERYLGTAAFGQLLLFDFFNCAPQS
jgi:hypothetical protein